jgi:hypothetical protein
MPWLGNGVVDDHLVLRHVKGDVGRMEEVVRKILLDDITLVSAADNEIVDAVLRVNFEDVPKDRPTTNFNHRLGAEGCFFREARAYAPGENYGFHAVLFLLLSVESDPRIGTVRPGAFSIPVSYCTRSNTLDCW